MSGYLFLPRHLNFTSSVKSRLLLKQCVLGFVLQTLDPLTKFGLTPEGLSAYLIECGMASSISIKFLRNIFSTVT